MNRETTVKIPDIRNLPERSMVQALASKDSWVRVVFYSKEPPTKHEGAFCLSSATAKVDRGEGRKRRRAMSAWWYLIGFLALMAFLFWASYKMEGINERYEREAQERIEEEEREQRQEIQ